MATTQQFQQALDFAKQNPNSPRAVELRRRIESGRYNSQLEELGLPTFEAEPVETEPVEVEEEPQEEKGFVASLKSALGVEKGQRGLIPTKSQVAETVGDIGETITGVGKQFAGARKDIQQITQDRDFNVLQKIMGTSGRLAGLIGGVVGEATVGAGKVALSEKAEQGIAAVVQGVAEDVSETEIAQNVVEWYGSLDKDEKLIVDSAGGIASLMAEVVGLKGTGRVGKEVARKASPVLEEGLRRGEEIVERATETTKEAITKAAPDTTGFAEGLIANINRISPSARQKFKAQQGVSEEQWLRERGIIGTREKTLGTLTDNFINLRQNVDEALEAIPGNYRDARITTVADEAAEIAAKSESPQAARMKELSDKAKGTGLTTSEINEVKRFYERNVKVGFMKDPTASSIDVQRATNRDSGIREALMDIADKGGFDNLRELNKEIQANKFLLDEIGGRMEGQAANNMMSLTDWIVVTPAVSDPAFLAGFVGKKLFGLESVKALAARALAGFPKVKDLLRADLDEITKRAQSLIKKQEDIRVQTEQAAVLADELQKSGLIQQGGEFGFVTEMPLPLTRQEQAMIRAAKNRDEQLQMVKYIVEQREQGKAIGEGFTVKDIDNVPILNPSERFDPFTMGEDII